MTVFTSTKLLLLFSTCAASQNSCPVSVSHTAGPELSVAADPEVSANLNLLQVGLSVHNGNSAPEVGLAKQRSEHLTTAKKDSVLGLLSGHVRELDRLLVSRASPTVVAVALVCIAAATFVFLLCCFASFSALWKPTGLLGRAQSSNEWMQTIPRRTLSRGPEPEAEEVWMKHVTRTGSNKLMTLFEELDQVEQSDDSPPGYITHTDLETAMSDPRVAHEFAALGITLSDTATIFTLLDQEQSGLVNMKAFVAGCYDMGGRAN